MTYLFAGRGFDGNLFRVYGFWVGRRSDEKVQEYIGYHCERDKIELRGVIECDGRIDVDIVVAFR